MWYINPQSKPPVRKCRFQVLTKVNECMIKKICLLVYIYNILYQYILLLVQTQEREVTRPQLFSLETQRSSSPNFVSVSPLRCRQALREGPRSILPHSPSLSVDVSVGDGSLFCWWSSANLQLRLQFHTEMVVQCIGLCSDQAGTLLLLSTGEHLSSPNIQVTSMGWSPNVASCHLDPRFNRVRLWRFFDFMELGVAPCGWRRE